MISPIDPLSVVDIMGKYLSVETQGRRLSRTCQQAHGKGGRAGVLVRFCRGVLVHMKKKKH